MIIGGCVDPKGFEPLASSMPLRRAPNCATGPDLNAGPAPGCGAEGNRTPDLFSAIEALSQLSYSPNGSTGNALIIPQVKCLSTLKAYASRQCISSPYFSACRIGIILGCNQRSGHRSALFFVNEFLFLIPDIFPREFTMTWRSPVERVSYAIT